MSRAGRVVNVQEYEVSAMVMDGSFQKQKQVYIVILFFFCLLFATDRKQDRQSTDVTQSGHQKRCVL